MRSDPRGPRAFRPTVEQDILYQFWKRYNISGMLACGHGFRLNRRFSKIFAERAFFQAREVEAMDVFD